MSVLDADSINRFSSFEQRTTNNEQRTSNNEQRKQSLCHFDRAKHERREIE